jgi:hypothetical protein
MAILITILLPSLLLLCFGGLLVLWIQFYRKPDHEVEHAALAVGWIALGLYGLWIALISVSQHQVPVLTLGQLSAFLGLLIWADQMIIHHRISQRLLVILPLTTVTLLLIAALLSGVRPSIQPVELRGGWAAFHVTLSLAGVAMLIGSGVFGSGSLVLHRQLLAKSFGRLFSALPSLGDMQRLRVFALYLGWLFITLSLASSLTWMIIERSGTPTSFTHLHAMFALWLIVTVLTLSERFHWLNQHRQARLSVGLSVVILLLVVASVIDLLRGVTA